VIDSGLARIGRYSHRSKMQRLPIEPVAQANLDQRAGRCGRLGPGVCIRLFDEEEMQQRPAFEAPEIQRSNLAGVILQMAHQRLGRIETFDFMDPPDDRLIRDGYTVLRELRALDEDDQITSLGRRMAALPLEPRLSRALLAAETFGCLDEGLIVVSALAVPDVRERREDSAASPSYVDAKSDWTTRLNLWRELHSLGSASAQRRWCKDAGVSWLRVLEWRDVQRQLRAVAKERKLGINERAADAPALHRALLTGFISHIGERLDNRNYRGARGRSFAIFPGSPVARAAPPWVVATEMIETSRVFGHGVAAVKPGWILEAADHLVQREPFDAVWSAGQGRATTRQRAVVFGLSIELRQRVPLAPIDAPGARALMIEHLLVRPPAPARGGVAGLPLSAHNRSMLAKAADWECRVRRTLLDEAALFRFFEQKVPRKVVDQKSFLSWYKKLDKAAQATLRLQDGDVGLDQLPSLASFPSEFVSGRNQLPLRYEFLPTSDTDGVTLSLPLPLLAQIGAGTLEWLVPGWLPEKVERLLRSLPKAKRKKLAPIAQTAAQFVAETVGEQGGFPEESLRQTLADYVRRRLGEPFVPDDLRMDALDPYLNVRIELLDTGGQVVDASRDVLSLAARHGAASHVVRAPDSSFEQGQVSKWSFGDLPDQVETRHGSVTVNGRPALAEKQGAVSLRVFADVEHADRTHAQGVARLTLLQLRDKQRYVQRRLPDANSLTLRYAALGDTDQLFDDIALGAIRALAPQSLSSVRTQQQFEALVNVARQQLIAKANELGALAQEILSGRQAVLSAITKKLEAAHPAVIADILSQVEKMVPPRFLRDTPTEWLDHLPRYLNAALRRLERLTRHGGENQHHRQDVVARWQRYLALSDETLQLRLTDWRWLLEEYRVSLFSQPIKTSRPASAKRLDVAWDRAMQG
ncbi:MAG: ATP-dependent RNA helicase HrpA, partial [Gammaproteobacteria bacterium]